MTVLRFKARNHFQQLALRGALDDVDDRRTPLELWEPLHAEFTFDLDAAASADNSLCDRYFTIEDDGLARSWGGSRVWCNPPFSACAAWVEKAWRERSDEGEPAEVVVMLLPANRTEQRWWQEMVEPFRDGRGELLTRFLPRRINFASAENPSGRYRSSAPFGCVLVIWPAAPAVTPLRTSVSAKR